MRLLVLAAMLAMGLPYLRAQQQSSADVAIRSVLARETDGWNKFDAGQVASTSTTDAVWQSPFGVRLHGQAVILKFLTELLARPGYRAGTSTRRRRFLTCALPRLPRRPSGAMKRLTAWSTITAATPMQPRHSYYLKVLVKQGGMEDQRRAHHGYHPPTVGRFAWSSSSSGPLLRRQPYGLSR